MSVTQESPIMDDVNLAEEGVTDLNDAIQKVIRNSLYHNGLARGLHEVAQTLDKGKAHFCFLSESCDEPAYKKLVTALCKEKEIPCIEVPDSKLLGEWAGLCKYDQQKLPRKIVGTSCVAVKDLGIQSEAITYLRKYLDEQNA